MRKEYDMKISYAEIKRKKCLIRSLAGGNAIITIAYVIKRLRNFSRSPQKQPLFRV